MLITTRSPAIAGRGAEAFGRALITTRSPAIAGRGAEAFGRALITTRSSPPVRRPQTPRPSTAPIRTSAVTASPAANRRRRRLALPPAFAARAGGDHEEVKGRGSPGAT